jgi:ribosomal protein S27AE
MSEYFRDKFTNVKYVEVTSREYEPENLEECDKTVCCKCGYGTTMHNHRLYCGKRQDFLEEGV